MSRGAGTPRERLALALVVSVAAGVTYAVTSHATWIFDPLRYADMTQRGEVEALLAPSHALANLVPLAIFEGLELLGYEGGALGVQGAVAVAGAAVAAGLTVLAATRIGAPLLAAAAAGLLMAATLGAWRAGGSTGVYGLTLAVLAAAWLVAARYGRSPSQRGLIGLGVATGVAACTHLGGATFALAAALLVGVGDRPSRGMASSRLGALGLFVLAGAATAAVLFALTAGLDTGWSPAAMLDWPSDLETDPADPGAAGDFGFTAFLRETIAAEPTTGWRQPHVAPLAALAALALALIGFAGMYREGRRWRILGAALMVHLIAALLAAGWFLAERGDYFSLALVPLALLWSRAPSIAALTPRATKAAAVAAAAIALGLGLWNARQGVQPSLDRFELHDQAADRVEEEVPSGSRVVVSPQLAPLLAYRGLDAMTGWAGLLESLGQGAPRPGLARLAAGQGHSVVISSLAFELTPAQADYLHTTDSELWSLLRSCCAPRALFTISTDAGPETVYLLRHPS